MPAMRAGRTCCSEIVAAEFAKIQFLREVGLNSCEFSYCVKGTPTGEVQLSRARDWDYRVARIGLLVGFNESASAVTRHQPNRRESCGRFTGPVFLTYARSQPTITRVVPRFARCSPVATSALARLIASTAK